MRGLLSRQRQEPVQPILDATKQLEGKAALMVLMTFQPALVWSIPKSGWGSPMPVWVLRLPSMALEPAAPDKMALQPRLVLHLLLLELLVSPVSLVRVWVPYVPEGVEQMHHSA